MKYIFLWGIFLSCSGILNADTSINNREDLSKICEDTIYVLDSIKKNIENLDQEQVAALISFVSNAYQLMKEEGVDIPSMFQDSKSGIRDIESPSDADIKEDIDSSNKVLKPKETNFDESGKTNNLGDMNLHDSSVNILQIDGNIEQCATDANVQPPCCNNNITVNGNVSIYGFIIDSNIFKYPDFEPVQDNPQENNELV